jgi:TetR/AcrR family transcriptional regulator, acrAB operon repressor
MARKTKEEAQETRHRILDAAEVVFQRQGVSRTSLNEIASEAGVTRGAIYWHFENKVALLDALLVRAICPEECPSNQSFGALDAATALTRFRDETIEFLQGLSDNPRQQRAFEITWQKCEYVGEMVAMRDRCLEHAAGYLELLEDIFTRARAAGLLHADVDPRRAAIGFLALVDGLIFKWTMAPQLYSPADVAPAVIDTYLRGLQKAAA